MRTQVYDMSSGKFVRVTELTEAILVMERYFRKTNEASGSYKL